METVPFGRTDMAITRVGFGAWAIGGGGWRFAWGEQDDTESVAAIRHAVEAGVNWVDTAAVYGLGHSEEVVAAALRDLAPADRPYVFTKCGLVWDEHDRGCEPRRVATPDSIRREVDASLRRLGVDRIDLYQVHWPPEDGPSEERSSEDRSSQDERLQEYWSAMRGLVDSGKVRAVGLSNHDRHQLEIAEKVGHVDSLQPPFSAIDRRAAADLLPWCADHDTGVIVYSPMQSGLLTGAFDEARAAGLGAGDWRSRSPDFTGDVLRRNLALAEALRPVAARHDVDPAAVAVGWTLAWPGVTAAIVGARRAGQVDGWLPAADLRLAGDDLTGIAAAIERTGAGAGPARPPARCTEPQRSAPFRNR